MFESGLGVARDYAMAKHLYKSASEIHHHASATNNLGWMYLLEVCLTRLFLLPLSSESPLNLPIFVPTLPPPPTSRFPD